MGARQSKRSVDILAATKKGEEAGVEEGKLERLDEGDVLSKTTQNGSAQHADKEASSPVTEEAQPTVNGDSETTEDKKEKEETEAVNGDKEEKKDESLVNGASESPEDKDKSTDDAATPEGKEKKKKEKSKKKWSFRSISFSRKDKSKPNVSKDEGKNGNVTKEEPVAEVVEAEAAANVEALPIKDDEAKKEETTERTEEEKKEEKKEETSTKESAVTEPVPPTPAEPITTPAPAEPAPAPAPAPASEPVTTPAPAPAPVAEPEEQAAPAPPTVETTPPPAIEEPLEVPVPEPEVEIVFETKTEELPPPLPASPPPTEAPPPTPVTTTPAPELPLPAPLDNEVDADTQEHEVGGGESMAEPVEEEPVVLETEEKSDKVPLVNGISDHSHEFVEEISEKVEIVTDSFKSIVTESLISTQVVNENSDYSESNKEQTASAAE